MAACMPDVASPDEVKVQEQKLSPSASRLGLLVTLISHSAAEERFFAREKKSDSAAAQRMSKLLLTSPFARNAQSAIKGGTAKAASCGGKSRSFRQIRSPDKAEGRIRGRRGIGGGEPPSAL